MPMGQQHLFKVYVDNGSVHTLLAENADDAVEEYYKSVASMIGHHLKICGCFGPKKLIDRSKLSAPNKIEELSGKDVIKTTDLSIV